MKFRKSGIVLGLTLMACLSCAARTPKPQSAPLVVGWDDELNDISGWQSLSNGNSVDAFAARPGAMMLRMRQVGPGYPYTYQWGGVTCPANVDLKRFPILVACVSHMQKGSYAHLEMEERDTDGTTIQTGRASTLYAPGLSVLDASETFGVQPHRFQLRLIVGGALTGASCEYTWVRFVRREDLKRLQSGADVSEVKLEPYKEPPPSQNLRGG